MTLNVPIGENKVPMAMSGQVFLVMRPHIEFRVQIDNLGTKTLQGDAYLTCFRIIFVSNDPNSQLKTFDIPIHLLYGQKVQFPFFGCHYLKGSCPPFQNLLPGHCHFKLWFKQGGCDALIRLLSDLIKETRRNMTQQQAFVQSQMYKAMNTGQFALQGYVNPNDPTKVFINAPNNHGTNQNYNPQQQPAQSYPFPGQGQQLQ